MVEIMEWVFSLGVGFMLSFGGVVVWNYCKGKGINRRYATVALVCCLVVIITNQLF